MTVIRHKFVLDTLIFVNQFRQDSRVFNKSRRPRNSPAIGREIAAYFSLEITPNFTNNIRNIGTEDEPWIRKDSLMKKTKDAREL